MHNTIEREKLPSPTDGKEKLLASFSFRKMYDKYIEEGGNCARLTMMTEINK